jgi:hypothetical protein
MADVAHRWRVTLNCVDTRTLNLSGSSHGRGSAAIADFAVRHRDDRLFLSWDQEGVEVRLSLNVSGGDQQSAEKAAKSLLLEALPGWLAVQSINALLLKAEPHFT